MPAVTAARVGEFDMMEVDARQVQIQRGPRWDKQTKQQSSSKIKWHFTKIVDCFNGQWSILIFATQNYDFFPSNFNLWPNNPFYCVEKKCMESFGTTFPSHLLGCKRDLLAQSLVKTAR